MEMIREWVMTILSVVMLVTFVEFLLPNSNHRRYINMIMGLMIMMVILKPIMALIDGGAEFDLAVFRNNQKIEQMTLSNRSQTLELHHYEQMMSLYRENLKKEMIQRLERDGYQVADIQLEIEEEDQRLLGKIKGVEILLAEEGKDLPRDAIEVPAIQVNVSLDGKKDNNLPEERILLVNEGEEIVSTVSNYYQIPKEDIRVTVQKRR